MRGRLPLVLILGGSLTFLASLYLSWDASVNAAGLNGFSSGSGSSGALSLLNLFSQSANASGFSGWTAADGQAAALCALALCAGATAALVRSQLVSRLPLARGALAFLFLAVMTLAQLRAQGLVFGAFAHARTEVEGGAYLGVASATAAFLGSVALRRSELRRPSPEGVLAAGLSGGLLAAFLVPELTFHAPHVSAGATVGYQLVDNGSYSGIFTATIACLALPLWRRGGSHAGRVVVGAALALLTAGSLSWLGVHRHWPWPAWLWLGCALGLLVLAVGTSSGLRFSRPSPLDAAIAVTALAVPFSLFLPWANGPFVATGWWAQAPLAGALAVVFVAALLGWRRLFPEIALAVAFYVMAAGFRVPEFGRPAYGSFIGFAAAALLLLGAGVRLRHSGAQASLLLSRALPVALCLAFLAVPIAGFAADRFEFGSPWRLSWLLLAAVVVDFRLLGRWLGSEASDELVLLPVALLALLGLDLIFIRDSGIQWGGWLSLALCVLLVALGGVAQRVGFERFRIPEEIWRVDRISSVED